MEIYNWRSDDIISENHLRYSPLCPLLNGLAPENVPIDVEAFEKMLTRPSVDECGVTEMKTETEGPFLTEEDRERMDHENVKKYLEKYGYRLVKK